MIQNPQIKKYLPAIKITSFLFAFILFYFIVVLLFKGPTENNLAYVNNNNNVFGLNIPQNLTFCGEQIPADNYEIGQNLEKEFFSSSHWKKNYYLLFQKASRWFPYIEPILKEEGVPEDVKYIAVIESHLSNSYSRAGAAGFWQLVPVTAQRYGLEVSDEVDERLDVEKSTHAACKVLKEAYARLKKWSLAAAAYNRGIAGIENALKNQGADNFYDLELNRESGEFLYRIVAYKTLLSNPKHFNIDSRKIKNYPKIPIKTVEVDSSITNLSALANKFNCSKMQLENLNPWLYKGFLNNLDKKVYKIKVLKFPNKDYSSYFSDLNPGYVSETKQVNDTISKAVIDSKE
ncbi:MAG: lytic transglycosylase domain-containing protein [Bacteroidia bacterium]|nr:lytic transglycosylase domain-containing protein [Bacteroidia bacterium]